MTKLASIKATDDNPETMAKQSILITGVYGLVGSCIYRHLIKKPDQYEVFGLDRLRQCSERVHPDEIIEVPESHFILADVSDKSALEEACQGIDTIVHLAADPNGEATWESVLENNIEGTHNLFESAKLAKVRRVIYASSIQVSFGYLHNVDPYKSICEGAYENVPANFKRITTSDPTWPVNLYGTSKVLGESLARMYSSTTDMSCICLRIGGVYSLDKVPRLIVPNGCTRRDLSRLVENCIQAPSTVDFETFYAVSNSEYRWTDIENAEKAVGYIPEDRISYED